MRALRMELLHFEIVDLGPGVEGYFDEWGPSFNGLFTASVIGSADTAKAAFNEALNQLAFDGYGTKLLHEAGIEMGLMSAAAETPAGDIEPHVEPDDDEVAGDDEPFQYHIGIRFAVPEEEPINA